MTYLIWLLRIVHILAGVFWVGGTLMMTYFIAPAIGASAEAGQKVAGHLMGNLKFSNRMSAAAGLTILAGAILYWIDSNGFTSAWMNSGPGRGFGIGAGFALVGFVFGIMVGRTTKSMAQLQGQLTAVQASQMQDLQRKQALYANVASVTLILSVVFMALARYLNF